MLTSAAGPVMSALPVHQAQQQLKDHSSTASSTLPFAVHRCAHRCLCGSRCQLRALMTPARLPASQPSERCTAPSLDPGVRSCCYTSCENCPQLLCITIENVQTSNLNRIWGLANSSLRSCVLNTELPEKFDWARHRCTEMKLRTALLILISLRVQRYTCTAL